MKSEIKSRIEQVRRGEVPEGYKRAKYIGLVPNNWHIGDLSEVVENKQRPVDKPNKPYWRLGIKSWAKGTFHAYVDDPSVVGMEELYLVKAEDLIVNITFAWEHAIAVASSSDDGLLVSHRFPTYIFKKGHIPNFYRVVVAQHYFKKMLENISPGGAGRNRVLNRKDFLGLPTIIPSFPEQRRIAEILSCCDKVIELKEQLIEEKKQLKKGLMQKLLDPSSGVRLPGFKRSEWSKYRLGSLGKFRKGGGVSLDCTVREGLPAMMYGDIYIKYNISFNQVDYRITANSAQKSTPVSCGDLLFTATGETALEIGKCVCYQGIPTIYIGGDIFSLRPKSANSLFLSYQLNSFSAIKQKARYGQGHSVVHIGVDSLKKIQIFLPPTIEEQTAIANILSAADYEIDLLEQELEAWQQKRKALMQLLLTGLARV